MNHPFFNPKSLSDEELVRKQQEIAKRIYDAYAVGFSHGIIDQLRLISESLGAEKEERDAKIMFDLINSSFPEVIESDRDWLSEEEKARASRTPSNINDGYVPETLSKEQKAEKHNGRQEQFKKWQEQQRKTPNNNPVAEERDAKGTPQEPKRRGRPKKVKTP